MKEDFKKFVNLHPELISYVNNNQMTWQKFYDMFSLYGTDNSVWNEYLKKEDCYDKKIHFSLIKYALKCNGKLVIVPIQDLLGLDTNSRVNVPGTTSNFNWSWKLKDFKGLNSVINEFSKLK